MNFKMTILFLSSLSLMNENGEQKQIALVGSGIHKLYIKHYTLPYGYRPCLALA